MTSHLSQQHFHLFSQKRPDSLEQMGHALDRKTAIVQAYAKAQYISFAAQAVLYVAFLPVAETLSLIGRICLAHSASFQRTVVGHLQAQALQAQVQSVLDTWGEDNFADLINDESTSFEAIWIAAKQKLSTPGSLGPLVESFSTDRLRAFLDRRIITNSGAICVSLKRIADFEALDADKKALLLSHTLGNRYFNVQAGLERLVATLEAVAEEDTGVDAYASINEVITSEHFDKRALLAADYSGTLGVLSQNEALEAIFAGLGQTPPTFEEAKRAAAKEEPTSPPATAAAEAVVEPSAQSKSPKETPQDVADTFVSELIAQAVTEAARLVKAQKEELLAVWKKVGSEGLEPHRGAFTELINNRAISAQAIANMALEEDTLLLNLGQALEVANPAKCLAILNLANVKSEHLGSHGIIDFASCSEEVQRAILGIEKFQERALVEAWYQWTEAVREAQEGPAAGATDQEAKKAHLDRRAKELLAVFRSTINSEHISPETIVRIGKGMNWKLSGALYLASKEKRAAILGYEGLQFADLSFDDMGFTDKEGTRQVQTAILDSTHFTEQAKEAIANDLSLCIEAFIADVSAETFIRIVFRNRDFSHLIRNRSSEALFMQALEDPSCPANILEAYSEAEKERLITDWPAKIAAIYALLQARQNVPEEAPADLLPHFEKVLTLWSEPGKREQIVQQLELLTAEHGPKSALREVYQAQSQALQAGETITVSEMIKGYERTLSGHEELPGSFGETLASLPRWALEKLARNCAKDPRTKVRLIQALDKKQLVDILGLLWLNETLLPASEEGRALIFDKIQEVITYIPNIGSEEDQRRAHPPSSPDINCYNPCTHALEVLAYHQTEEGSFPYLEPVLSALLEGAASEQNAAVVHGFVDGRLRKSHKMYLSPSKLFPPAKQESQDLIRLLLEVETRPASSEPAPATPHRENGSLSQLASPSENPRTPVKAPLSAVPPHMRRYQPSPRSPAFSLHPKTPATDSSGESDAFQTPPSRMSALASPELRHSTPASQVRAEGSPLSRRLIGSARKLTTLSPVPFNLLQEAHDTASPLPVRTPVSRASPAADLLASAPTDFSPRTPLRNIALREEAPAHYRDFVISVIYSMDLEALKGYLTHLDSQDKSYWLNLISVVLSAERYQGLEGKITCILEAAEKHLDLAELSMCFCDDEFARLVETFSKSEESEEKDLAALVKVFVGCLSKAVEPGLVGHRLQFLEQADIGFCQAVFTFILQHQKEDEIGALAKALVRDFKAMHLLEQQLQGVECNEAFIQACRTALEDPSAIAIAVPLTSVLPSKAFADTKTPSRALASMATQSTFPGSPAVGANGAVSDIMPYGSSEKVRCHQNRITLSKIVAGIENADRLFDVLSAIQNRNIMAVALRALNRSDNPVKLEVLKRLMPRACELLKPVTEGPEASQDPEHRLAETLTSLESLEVAVDYLQAPETGNPLTLKALLRACGERHLAPIEWLGKLALTRDTIEWIFSFSSEEMPDFRKAAFLLAALENENPSLMIQAWSKAPANIREKAQARVSVEHLTKIANALSEHTDHPLFIEALVRMLRNNKKGQSTVYPLPNLVQIPCIQPLHIAKIIEACKQSFAYDRLPDILLALKSRTDLNGKMDAIKTAVIQALESHERAVKAFSGPSLRMFIEDIAKLVPTALKEFLVCLDDKQIQYLAENADLETLRAIGKAYKEIPFPKAYFDKMEGYIKEAKWNLTDQQEALKALLGDAYKLPVEEPARGKAYGKSPALATESPHASPVLPRRNSTGSLEQLGDKSSELIDLGVVTPLKMSHSPIAANSRTAAAEPVTPRQNRLQRALSDSDMLMTPTVGRVIKTSATIAAPSPRKQRKEALAVLETNPAKGFALLEVEDLIGLLIKDSSLDKEKIAEFIAAAKAELERSRSAGVIKKLTEVINKSKDCNRALCIALVKEVMKDDALRDRVISKDLAAELCDLADQSTGKLPEGLGGLMTYAFS